MRESRICDDNCAAIAPLTFKLSDPDTKAPVEDEEMDMDQGE